MHTCARYKNLLVLQDVEIGALKENLRDLWISGGTILVVTFFVGLFLGGW